MTGDEFKVWRKRMGLSVARTEKALGLSHTTICKYESLGDKPIPKYIGMACNFYAFIREQQGMASKG